MTAYKGKSKRSQTRKSQTHRNKTRKSQTRKQRGGIGSFFTGHVNGTKISEGEKSTSLAQSYQEGTNLIHSFMEKLTNSGALLKMKSGLALKLNSSGDKFEVIGVLSRKYYTQMNPEERNEALKQMLLIFRYKEQAALIV